MEIPLFMIVKMEFLRGSPVAVSTAVLFQKKNGTPMNTPPIKDGIAGNFIATATITKIGGSRERTLILDEPWMKVEISSTTDMSTALLEACMKPITA